MTIFQFSFIPDSGANAAFGVSGTITATLISGNQYQINSISGVVSDPNYAAKDDVIASLSDFDGADGTLFYPGDPALTNSPYFDTQGLSFATNGDQYNIEPYAPWGSGYAQRTSHAYGSGAFNLTPACYVSGTRIRVEREGVACDAAIDDLVIGDHVVTISGARRPIRWLGRRSYSGRFANANPDVLPICFMAGCLAENQPERDLWVSPKHSMLLDGMLVPAEHLVNGLSVIKATRVDRVDYFHIELDSHDVLLAEGAPSESFVDDNGRQIFQNAHEHAALYPNASLTEAKYCAPRRQEGLALEAVRRRIDARSRIGASAAAC